MADGGNKKGLKGVEIWDESFVDGGWLLVMVEGGWWMVFGGRWIVEWWLVFGDGGLVD